MRIVDLDTQLQRLAHMKRNTITALRIADEMPNADPARPDRWLMATLTYQPGIEWEARHVTETVRAYRRYLRRHVDSPLIYAWVLEMQKRGAPHYHLAIRSPQGRKLPMPDEAGYWPHGSTRIEWARNAVGYMAKYLSKINELERYPKGARISGFGGLSESGRIERRRWLAPAYVREAFEADADPIRRRGGGWLDRETGEICPSRYQCIGRSRKTVRLIDLWETVSAQE